MTLVRRCDGCGKDIENNQPSSWKIVRPREVIDLDFHNENCVALWSDRNRGKAKP